MERSGEFKGTQIASTHPKPKLLLVVVVAVVTKTEGIKQSTHLFSVLRKQTS